MYKLFNRTALTIGVSTALVAAASHYWLSSDTNSEFQISAEQKAYLAQKQAQKEAHPKRFDKPQEALEFYIKQRVALGETTLPTEKYAQAIRHIESMPQYSLSKNQAKLSRNQLKANGVSAKADGTNVIQEWENIGPGNIGGRTRALVINPTTPEIMYAAGVAGGVWKSIDAGANWQPLSDMAVNLAVTSLTLDPNDANTLYAGTGEGFYNIDALRGDGIFKSTDAGVTWSQLAATAANNNFRYVNKVEASHNVAGRLYAATRGGVFITEDAGNSWTQIMQAPDFMGCLDIKVRSDVATDELLVSCGSFGSSGVYRSVDAGTTFSKVIDDPILGRTTLAYAPSNQNIVYALASSNQNDPSVYRFGFYKLYRSADGGATWEVKNTTENADVKSTLLLSNSYFGMLPECSPGAERAFYNQGWYDNIIQVDPVNPDVVWAGGIDIWRSNDAGATWDATSRWWDGVDQPSYAHADQHALVFHPNYNGNTNKTLYVGNDGGIQRTDNTDGATLGVAGICGDTPPANSVTWTGLNNSYAVTQFYHGTVFPDGTAYFGGTQDNGTNLGTDATGAQAWFEVSGGDGGWVAVDPRNPDIIFTEYTGLSLQRLDPTTRQWVDATNGILDSDLFPFITPFMMDSNNPDILWIGNNRLWRTIDQGDNWVQASTPTIDDSIISEWAVAPGNSDRVIAGTESGFLMSSSEALSANDTTEWSSVKPTDGYVSDIAINPTNNLLAYATYSTFGVPHVWQTNDGGVTWEAIDSLGQPNGLPDVPVNTIVIDPSNTSRLIVGTDLGVFISVDAGNNWSADGSGLANTAVAHLEINNDKLYAFTHGRSAYRVALLATTLPTSATTAEDTAINLSMDLFNAFVGGQPQIDAIALENLPTQGQLILDGSALTEATTLTIAQINAVSFVPAADFNGSQSITWHPEFAGKATSTSGEFTLQVTPVNDAPTFSLTPVKTKVETNQPGVVVVAKVTPSATPADEASQSVTYSVSPANINFGTVSINSNTGELSVSQIGDREGRAQFVVIANDGQAENNTYSQTINFEVKAPKSGGSFGWLVLLFLPLAVLRKKWLN